VPHFTTGQIWANPRDSADEHRPSHVLTFSCAACPLRPNHIPRMTCGCLAKVGQTETHRRRRAHGQVDLTRLRPDDVRHAPRTGHHGKSASKSRVHRGRVRITHGAGILRMNPVPRRMSCVQSRASTSTVARLEQPERLSTIVLQNSRKVLRIGSPRPSIAA
jgi:hypothetical protein